MILKKEILETKRKNIDETIDLIQIQKNICNNVSLLNIILSNYVANILRCNDYTSPFFVILLSFILFYGITPWNTRYIYPSGKKVD